MQDDAFPGRERAIELLNRFFDTIAVVHPYVGKSVLLREIDVIELRTGTWQSCSPSMQALLNIVFAYALATYEDGASEPFYRRALGLLDERGLYKPAVESLQALLLLASFQQNSQRAMESVTTLFRAVKAAYQIGVHSPSSYAKLGWRDQELRSALWFAVVHTDRYLVTRKAKDVSGANPLVFVMKTYWFWTWASVLDSRAARAHPSFRHDEVGCG
ncbi:hypothetical protein UVI_02057320 [Ustilaginoidea virens]|uniref:Xylanolytic transcriptional activator regulatory domain-containing protein n=1 Tax=Ustilaginoidea virens TaxID=1159556 RepID=A0A1B5L1H4_USTVR|nr:hypothetical protein UVI_02057320 [Ustilaginoidea virens]